MGEAWMRAVRASLPRPPVLRQPLGARQADPSEYAPYGVYDGVQVRPGTKQRRLVQRQTAKKGNRSKAAPRHQRAAVGQKWNRHRGKERRPVKSGARPDRGPAKSGTWPERDRPKAAPGQKGDRPKAAHGQKGDRPKAAHGSGTWPERTPAKCGAARPQVVSDHMWICGEQRPGHYGGG
eukprot:scaffold19963_cov79-Isochrysis_galbana.AAC.1